VILAHGIGGRSDLPVPFSVLVTAAAAVLVVTFLLLSVAWTRPRLQDGPRYNGPSTSVPGRRLLGALGVLGLFLVIGQVIPVLLGVETSPTSPTVAPVLVWVVFWLVIPFGAAIFGNWYADVNPWRTLGEIFGVGRMERIGLPVKLGVWPALAALLGFVWLELVSPSSGDPVVLGVAALVYTVAVLLAMVLVGRETGLTVFDAFTPYNRLISAISPVGRKASGGLVWRGWLRSLAVVPEWPGLWVFVVTMIATVSYDGASGAAWFQMITGDLGDTLSGKTFLLAASVNLIALAYYLACVAAARLAGGTWTARRVAQRFAHTLVPIALAYAVSHYLTLILFEGQQLISAISDPFGLGWDLFGTAGLGVNYFLTSSTPIWFLQVGFIVMGHLVGIVLAHDRSLHDFGRGAVRSQYAMLVLMIALTSLGLLILSG
jgi:hypothetical protein